MKRLIYTFILIIFSFFIISADVKAAEEVLILFDSSISMMDDLDGQPKYVQAIKAAKMILDQTDPSRKIGMRIIGVQMNRDVLKYIFNPKKMCTATSMVNSIRENNIDNIKDSLDLITPLGTTPLTYSLSVAVSEDFHNGKDLKHIILITDGAESCDMDPCKYIREIMEFRKDIKIDVIAINVTNDSEIAQLKCLTKYTNGKLMPVTSSTEFETAFNNAILPVALNYNLNGSSTNNGANSDKNVRFKNYCFEF